ncbi:phage tail tape measure protein [Rhizobium deserti]|uniref:Phage tail tape measure protein n=1 Tax=Rhizobium deserti TaxID=2547961 RepID=A0A4R5UH51_9HYPH|nr:phage tail tape measure protein [Rhizobium deserti]TDK35197.1 phage tail tape measure protein [Rhizobium deserti]
MNSVIGALRVVLGLDSAAFDKGLTGAQSRLAKFGPAIKQGLAVAGAAAVAAGAAIGVAVKGAIDEADKMDEIAQKIGIGTEELSRLKYAAEINGVAFETLQGSVGKLSKNMVSAATGTGDAAKAFQKLGIGVKSSDGSLKSASTVMQEIADKFAAMPDGAQKTAMAMQLMGKSGAEMILMLNGGSAALAQTMKDADKFGQVFTAEMGANAGKFNENLDKIMGTMGSLAAVIAGQMLPYLTEFSSWLLEAVTYFRELSPETQSFVTIAAGLTTGLAALAVPLGLVAVGIAAIGAPIAAAVAGLALLSAGVVAFWPQIQQLGTAISEFLAGAWAGFVSAWDGVAEKVGSVGTAVKQLAADILSAFAALPGQMLEIGGQIIDGLW